MNPYGLVRVRDAAPGVLVDLRYAGDSNFLGRPVYDDGEAWLLEGTARKLAAARDLAAASGLRLLVLDAYRPLAAQRLMWELLPDGDFVAPPDRGSVHNRGAAVDVTLADSSGRELAMPCPFDEFSERASHAYEGGSAEARANRGLLRRAMESAGFRAYENEWWHYNDPDLRQSPLIDESLAALASLARA